MFKKLLQPGESVDYSASGSWVRVDAGTRVIVQSNNGEKAPLNGRDSVQFKQFSSLTITNRHSVAEVVELRVSAGRIVAAGDESVVRISETENAVHVANAAEIGAAVSITTGDVVVSNVTLSAPVEMAIDQIGVAEVPDVPVSNGQTVQVVPANANRREVVLQMNAGANLCAVRVGSATVAVGRGLKVLAGAGMQGSITLNTTAAIHVRNEGPDQVDIAVLEVTK
jgi:hypothetical protein